MIFASSNPQAHGLAPLRLLCALGAVALLGTSLVAWPTRVEARSKPGAPKAEAAARAGGALPGFASFATPADMTAACDAGLKTTRALVSELEKRKPDLAFLAALDDLNNSQEDLYNGISLLGNVHPDQAMRDAAQACDLKWQDFNSTLGQNEVLYRLLKAVKTKDAIDARFRQLALEGFEDAGVGLPAGKRQQAKAMSDRMAALGLDFEKNIRDSAIKVAYKPSELTGVPADVLAAAKRDEAGNLLLGLDSPSYMPVMFNAEDGQVRERLWRAKQNEGGDANIKLLGEMVKTRKAYAELFGLSSFAEFTLRRRMAQNTARTQRFLDELRSAVEAGERREITQLQAAKAKHLNAANAKLERWDVLFYEERIKRERYSVDQQLFRSYFPPQESLRFVMSVAERLFGIKYTPVEMKLWHPDAQAFAVSDAKTGQALASLLVDLYPREGKYNHAAVWSNRNSASRVDRLPQAALIVNFDRKGLTLDELETLLHEFGHALHNNLSTTRYASLGGTSTLRDFVEAPSQMLEDWVYDPKVLATFKQVCAPCKPVPAELILQAAKARDHGKSVRYARQHLYATYDLALHSAAAPEPLDAWASMEGATPLGHVKGTKFPAGFGHLAGGYAAGYYGYLWSEVVARDLRTAFVTDKLSPQTGQRYRQSVLANGGQKPPQALVKEFLGRDSNAKAFDDYLRRQ